MKREYNRPSGAPLVMHRVLIGILLVLAAIIVVGSVMAIFRSPESEPLIRLGKREAADAIQGEGFSDGEMTMFNGIGRRRIPLAGPAASTVIFSINFPYPASDRLFAEELASNIGNFRFIADDYFSSLRPDQIAFLDEDSAKAEILSRYNALLRLGKIRTLYISDFMVID